MGLPGGSRVPAEGRRGASVSGARAPQLVSRPFSVPHVCHHRRWSVGPWRPPRLFQVPGVVPWLSEAQAKAQAQTDEREKDRWTLEWPDPLPPNAPSLQLPPQGLSDEGTRNARSYTSVPLDSWSGGWRMPSSHGRGCARASGWLCVPECGSACVVRVATAGNRDVLGLVHTQGYLRVACLSVRGGMGAGTHMSPGWGLFLCSLPPPHRPPGVETSCPKPGLEGWPWRWSTVCVWRCLSPRIFRYFPALFRIHTFHKQLPWTGCCPGRGSEWERGFREA